MTNRTDKWLVPAVAVVMGFVIAAAELSQHASPWLALSAVLIMGTYAVAIFFLRSRSETVSLLSGVSVDERWESINQRALAAAAQLTVLALVVAFVGVEATGGDAMPYAWMAAVFGLAYLGSILWFRWRS